MGMNFHTGDKVAAGNVLTACAYSSFSVPGGVQAQPLAYGIKAFDLGAVGRIFPLKVSSPSAVKFSAYAALDNGTLRVTLINREHGPNAPALDVTLEIADAAGPAESLQLSAPEGNVAAKEGITLGGSVISAQGTWKGEWRPVAPQAKGCFRLPVPRGAVILRVRSAAKEPPRLSVSRRVRIPPQAPLLPSSSRPHRPGVLRESLG